MPQITIQDEDILNAVSTWRDKAKEFQSERSTNRTKWYKEFRGMPYGNERKGLSTSVRSVIWEVIQGITPGLVEIFTGDFFAFKGEDAIRADKFQKLIEYQLFRKQPGPSIIDSFVQDCLLNEFGILKVFYKDDFDLEPEEHDELSEEQFQALQQQPGVTVSKFTPVEMYPMGMIEPIRAYRRVKAVRRVTNYAGPVLEVVPPWEFYVSPDAKSVDDAKYCAHWVRRDLSYIKRQEKLGIYRKGSYAKVEEKLGKDTDEQGDILAEKEARQSASGTKDYENLGVEDTDNKLTKSANEVTIKEEYLKLDLDGDGLLEPAIVVSCNDIILSVVENPYKRPPFRLGRAHPEPHKITGISYAEILSSDQRIQTNILRLVQDNAAFSTWVNPMTPDPKVKNALDTRRPFDTILADPNKIGWFQHPQPSNASFKLIELNDSMIENKTGVTKYNQGLDSNSLNKTATGINIIASMAMQKQKLVARRIGETMKDVLRDFMMINQMYPPKDIVRIVGENMQIDPTDLRGEYEIIVTVGVGPQEKLAAAQQMDTFLLQYGQMLLQLGVTSPEKLRDAVVYRGKLIEAPFERFVLSSEEMKQGTAAQMQEMQGMIQQLQQELQQMQQENAGQMKEAAKMIKDLRGENDTIKQQIQASQQNDPRIQMALKSQEMEINTRFKDRELDHKMRLKDKELDHKLAAKDRELMAGLKMKMASSEIDNHLKAQNQQHQQAMAQNQAESRSAAVEG